MASESVFEFVARELEQITDLDRLEARGTVRLALKQAGLDAKTVTAAQMAVVLQKVLPGELEARGVEGAAGICERLAQAAKGFQGGAAESDESSPEAVFKRIGGG